MSRPKRKSPTAVQAAGHSKKQSDTQHAAGAPIVNIESAPDFWLNELDRFDRTWLRHPRRRELWQRYLQSLREEDRRAQC